MNGIEKIAGKIADDAKQEADAILAEAQAEAGAITEKYAALAQEESGKILDAGQEQAKEIARRTASAADQDAKQKLLAAKQNMISRAFEAAMQKLLGLPDKEYIDLLAKLAAEAASSGKEEIILSPTDRPRCGKQVMQEANRLLAKRGMTAALTLSAETRDMDGGLLLKAGDVEVNSSLNTILRLSREELTLEVVGALFP